MSLDRLVDSWCARSQRYAAQAQQLDAADKPQEALRLGTYALLWNLAAHELTLELKEQAELLLGELAPELREVTDELFPQRLRVVR